MAEGVDYPVDRGVDPSQHPVRLSDHVRPRVRGATATRPYAPYSSALSLQQAAVRAAIAKHGQLTSSQLRRLLYTGSDRGTHVRCSRHLKRLTDLGLIRRFWGVYDGPAEFIYMPAGTTSRGPVFHTLDISELNVRLSEANYNSDSPYYTSGPKGEITFDREPWCHIKIGQVEVKPDAFLRFNEQEQYFIEVDRSSADRTKLAKKLRQYVNLFEQWDVDVDGETFPLVFYTVPDTDRKRVIESVIKTQRYPRLFKCLVFDEAVDRLTGG